jgi:hypothetical protein
VDTRRRKPAAELVDRRLREFSRADWETDADTNHFDAFHAWKAARAEWVAEHPDSLALGGAGERFFVEFQTQMAQYDPKAQNWSDYERGNSSFGWDSASSKPPHGQFPRKPQPPKQSRAKRRRDR